MKYEQINISLEDHEIKFIDKFVQNGQYQSREEFILDIVNDKLKRLENPR